VTLIVASKSVNGFLSYNWIFGLMPAGGLLAGNSPCAANRCLALG